MYCSPTCICNIKGEYLLELHNTYCSRINGFLLINNNYGGINRVLIFIKSMYPCNPRILVPAKINDSTMFESKINYILVFHNPCQSTKISRLNNGDLDSEFPHFQSKAIGEVFGAKFGDSVNRNCWSSDDTFHAGYVDNSTFTKYTKHYKYFQSRNLKTLKYFCSYRISAYN